MKIGSTVIEKMPDKLLDAGTDNLSRFMRPTE
jgi:hypothetical protein